MNFRNKLLMYHTIATALVAIPAQSLATDINLQYQEYSLESDEAQKLWSIESAVAEPLGKYDPWTMIATVKIPGMQDIKIGQLFSSGHCGYRDCPLKIMQGDQVLYDGFACDAYESHQFSTEFRALLACENIIPIELK